MRLLLDADIVAFKAASSAEQPVYWGDGLWTLHSYESDAQASANAYLDRLRDKFGDVEIKLFLTDKLNWRKDVLPTYKSNRKDVRKPLVLPAIKGWMVQELGATSAPRLEADDLLGIEATRNGGIIVSEDKDLQTIPCTLYNPAKDTDPREITEFEADYKHMFQTLTGDSTDGYAGCPTVGPKKAEGILKGCTTVDQMWQAVVTAFEKQNLNEFQALVQARVARICRDSDYNRKYQQVILWEPPTT